MFCAVDMGDGRLGGGVFVVPLNEGGVTRGQAHRQDRPARAQPGRDLLRRAEGVRRLAGGAARRPIAPPPTASCAWPMAAWARPSSAAPAPRSSWRSDYAKERVQGDVPIFKHQSMKSRLFKMYQKVEAARALNQRVVRINATRATPLLELAIASKVTSTQAAFDVASEALQVFGGAGISPRLPDREDLPRRAHLDDRGRLQRGARHGRGARF